VKATEWWNLPEGIRMEMLRHYSRIECRIFVELEIAGIVFADTDYDDETWDRCYTFATWAEWNLFLSLVSFDDHPSGQEWEYNFDEGYTVWIPRLDLHIVYRNLARLNAIVIDDYVEKKRRETARYNCLRKEVH